MKDILRWKYLISVVVVLVGSALLAFRVPFSHTTGMAAMTSALVLSLAGIVVGTAGFVILRHVIDAASVRMVCGFVSATGGAGVGFIRGFTVVRHIWDALVFGPHASYHGGDYAYGWLGFVSIVVTALVSGIFGAGIGLSLGTDKERRT